MQEDNNQGKIKEYVQGVKKTIGLRSKSIHY